MIEINLIPDVKQELIKAQRTRTKVITISIVSGVVCLITVSILLLYIFAFQSIRGAVADGKIADGSKKLASVADLSKTLTLQNQLTKISTLTDSKHINSRIFDMLTAIIPADPLDPNKVMIQVSELNVDTETATITIDGQAENSYTAVETFKKTIDGAVLKFKDSNGDAQEVTLASNISTSNASYGADSSGMKVLRFTLSFTYAEDLLSILSKELTISVSNNGNVTDSYLGVPKSIFADRAADLEGNK